MNPTHRKLGTLRNLDASLLPRKAQSVVRQWVAESFFALRVDHEPHWYFFTIVPQLLFFHQWITGDSSLPRYLHKVEWVAGESRRRWLFRGSQTEKVYVVQDLLEFYGMRSEQALSRAVSLLRCVSRVLLLLYHKLNILLAIYYATKFLSTSAFSATSWTAYVAV